MPQSQRVTLSLPADLVSAARVASKGNLSRFVASVLRHNLERTRRRELRKASPLSLQACSQSSHPGGTWD